MKICLIHNSPQSPQENPLLSMIVEVGRKVLRPDTQFNIKPLKRGMVETRDYLSTYFDFLNKSEVIDAFIEAEGEGYDAVVVNCFGDPGIREAREILGIPVIGPAESTMLFACLLGRRFCVITLDDPEQLRKVEMQIETYGLQSRTIPNPVRPFSIPGQDALMVAFENPKEFASAMLKKAKECVKDGAEAIILGCGGFGPPCTVAGLVKVEGSNAPILDPIAIALKTAETAADLQRSMGLSLAAKGVVYASPTREDIKRVRAIYGLGNPYA